MPRPQLCLATVSQRGTDEALGRPWGWGSREGPSVSGRNSFSVIARSHGEGVRGPSGQPGHPSPCAICRLAASSESSWGSGQIELLLVGVRRRGAQLAVCLPLCGPSNSLCPRHPSTGPCQALIKPALLTQDSDLQPCPSPSLPYVLSPDGQERGGGSCVESGTPMSAPRCSISPHGQPCRKAARWLPRRKELGHRCRCDGASVRCCWIQELDLASLWL